MKEKNMELLLSRNFFDKQSSENYNMYSYLYGGINMIAVNYTTLRENMKQLFDQVADEDDIMIVTRKNENMVIMSQDYYDGLMETIYLMSNPSNHKRLIEAINDKEEKHYHEHELVEVDDEGKLL